MFKKITGIGITGIMANHNSSKKLNINEIRRQQSNCIHDTNPFKGAKCAKIMLKKASKEMYKPLIPMFYPIQKHM